jgi:16S rRNA C967 or C1407 C5-methylase (RsmB/RsmF family)/NOL1/NOP2/fmu family ribosome biogenesis protein
MTAVTPSTLPLEQIGDALGDVPLPGQLADLADAMAKPKRNVLRCRRGIAPQELPLPTSVVPWYELGHRPIAPSPKPSRFLAYAAGDYYVQDAGSLLALAAVGAETSSLSGQLVCDLCAAPGGKASALVEAIGDAGFVLANEAIRNRIGPLQLNLARTGSDRYAISNFDPDPLADRLAGIFDVVVVDAPCSGQAMLARGKQKVSSLSSNQIQYSARRQQRILDAAVRLLRDGGKLVYSTCTFAQAENESQVQRLIDSGVSQPHVVDRLAQYQTSVGCYRVWPHLHDCAGSFAASMTVDHDVQPVQHRTRRRREAQLPIDLKQWYDSVSSTMRQCVRDAVILSWPDDAPDWVDEIALAGPELAHRAGQTWKPAHAGALRRVTRAKACDRIDIDDEAAKRYLRGEPIPTDRKGWQVVCLGGRPLGWVKGNGSVGKNHLPTAARMLGELIS